jgi:hypothetical protein
MWDARDLTHPRRNEMHRRLKAPSPALVISLIALFVALGGTGYAASNAVFRSPSKAQIIKIVRAVAPKLSVKSAAGLSTLPSGHTESGMFATAGDGFGEIALSIDYPRPLSAAIADANIIDAHLGGATHCPGAGQADPGYLCLYNNNYDGLSGGTSFYSNDGGLFPVAQGKLGVVLYWGVINGGGYVGGSWTVGAP